MNQALHIFRANARHHRARIALVVLMVGIGAAVRSRGTQSPFDLVVVLGVWFLIEGAVHDETIPGDRQFWVTRPYRWQSLLGAKVLFVLAFVSWPVLVTDCAMLYKGGFSPFDDLGGLLARQVLVNLWLSVPPLALAAVTNGLAEFAGVAVTLALVVTSNKFLGYLPDTGLWAYGFVSSLILTAFSVATIVFALLRQYSARSTAVCRVVVAVAGLGWLLPWTHEAAQWLAIGAQGGTASAALVAPDLGRRPEWEGGSCLALPVQMEEGPEPVGAQVTVDAAGFHWTSKWLRGVTVVEHASGKWMKVCLNQKDFDRVVSLGDAAISATVLLGVWGGTSEVRVPFSSGRMRIPGMGNCSQAPFGLSCYSPLRPERRASIVWEDRGLHLAKRQVGSFEPPYEVEEGLNPLVHWSIPLRGDWRQDFTPGPNTELVVSIRKDPAILKARLSFPQARIAR
jgi:hypothetical protein